MPVHRFVSDSVTIQTPQNWVVVEDESTVGKLIILSDARLKDAHAPTNGAMGIVKIYVIARAQSPVEMLRGKLYAEGGPPDGVQIEPKIISGNPAARMAGLDELFDQIY